MSLDKLRELVDAAAKATQAPWSKGFTRSLHYGGIGPRYEVPVCVGEGGTQGNALAVVHLGGPGAIHAGNREDIEANAEFIALARNAIPDLESLLSRHEALKAAMREAIEWIEHAPEDTWGYGSTEDARWPLRDELASKLRKSAELEALAEDK